MEANVGNTLVYQAASVGNCRQKEEVSVSNLKDIQEKKKKKRVPG